MDRGGTASAAWRRGWPVPVEPLPARLTTVREMVEHQAMALGSRPFLVLPDRRLSFGETDELANRAANAFARLGCGEGDIVMARCANGWSMLATWLGCAKLGAVFMPINGLLTGDPLVKVMGHAGAATVVCDAPLAHPLDAVRDRLPQLRHVLIAGAGPGAESFDRLVEEAPSGPPPPLVADAGAPGKLMYTSGTTGTPKGVVWSRHCEATWAHAYAGLLGLAEGEGAYCCLPMFHVTCQGTLLGTLLAGGRLTVDDGFDAFGFWPRVRRADARVVTFVGSILSALARLPEREDDADNPVRRIMGAAAPADLWHHIEQRFGVEIVETWGQTETASCWTSPPSLPQRPGTVGRPNRRWEPRLVGPDGHDVEPGETGELWIRPRYAHVLFEGYLSGDGVTDEAWTADGWYRTGDLLRKVEDGDFAFVGRLRDAIRRRGELIAAGEVEEAALAHPAVLEAAAVGVPADDGVEEEVLLVFVPRAGMSVERSTLHAFLRQRLPRFMVPRFLTCRSELPKTPSFRVQKYALRESGRAGSWDARHPV